MATILEQGGAEATDGRPTVAQTDVGSGVIFTRLVDFNEVSDIVIRFPFATRATEMAVQAFADDHRTGTFEYTLPNGGATIHAELVEPPDIRRRNSRTCSISVRIRRTLLID